MDITYNIYSWNNNKLISLYYCYTIIYTLHKSSIVATYWVPVAVPCASCAKNDAITTNNNIGESHRERELSTSMMETAVLGPIFDPIKNGSFAGEWFWNCTHRRAWQLFIIWLHFIHSTVYFVGKCAWRVLAQLKLGSKIFDIVVRLKDMH